MPSTVIVDRKGTMRYVHQGYKPGDESQYQDQIRSLLRE
jgi:peroxiredoxin